MFEIWIATWCAAYTWASYTWARCVEPKFRMFESSTSAIEYLQENSVDDVTLYKLDLDDWKQRWHIKFHYEPTKEIKIKRKP